MKRQKQGSTIGWIAWASTSTSTFLLLAGAVGLWISSGDPSGSPALSVSASADVGGATDADTVALEEGALRVNLASPNTPLPEEEVSEVAQDIIESTGSIDEESDDVDYLPSREEWFSKPAFAVTRERFDQHFAALRQVVLYLHGDVSTFDKDCELGWEKQSVQGAFRRLQTYRAERQLWMVSRSLPEDEPLEDLRWSIENEGEGISVLLGYGAEWKEMQRLAGEGVNMSTLKPKQGTIQ